MTVKTFRLGAVLTITTGKLLCSMDDVYAILNHMTGDSLFAHQLPRAMDECVPYLRAQFPAIAAETAEDVAPDTWAPWLLRAIEKYGDSFDVTPIPRHAHESIDPLSELARLRSIA